MSTVIENLLTLWLQHGLVDNWWVWKASVHGDWTPLGWGQGGAEDLLCGRMDRAPSRCLRTLAGDPAGATATVFISPTTWAPQTLSWAEPTSYLSHCLAPTGAFPYLGLPSDLRQWTNIPSPFKGTVTTWPQGPFWESQELMTVTQDLHVVMVRVPLPIPTSRGLEMHLQWDENE